MKRLLFSVLLSLYSPVVATAQEQTEIDFVRAFFNRLQPKSIAANREYCGYFGFNERNEFAATQPTRGRRDSCLPDEPPVTLEVFASYHTHGGYSVDADSELPSAGDMEADIAEETDGYIATPGGRLWFIDTRREKARMLCGRKCLVSDNRFDETALTPVRKNYTLRQLYQRDLVD
jgi:uncharacterized protein DUF4329